MIGMRIIVNAIEHSQVEKRKTHVFDVFFFVNVAINIKINRMIFMLEIISYPVHKCNLFMLKVNKFSFHLRYEPNNITKIKRVFYVLENRYY